MEQIGKRVWILQHAQTSSDFGDCGTWCKFYIICKVQWLYCFRVLLDSDALSSKIWWSGGSPGSEAHGNVIEGRLRLLICLGPGDSASCSWQISLRRRPWCRWVSATRTKARFVSTSPSSPTHTSMRPTPSGSTMAKWTHAAVSGRVSWLRMLWKTRTPANWAACTACNVQQRQANTPTSPQRMRLWRS